MAGVSSSWESLCLGDIPVKAGAGAGAGLSQSPVVQHCWLLGESPVQKKASRCVALQPGCPSSGYSPC